MSSAPSLILVWVERAADGSASGLHLRGTLARLRLIPNVKIRSIIADTTPVNGAESAPQKIWRIFGIVARAIMAARPSRTLLARNHPCLTPVVILWRLAGAKVVLLVQGSLDDVGGSNYPALANSRLFRAFARLGPRLAHGLIAGAPILEPHIRREMLGKRASYENIPNGVFVDEIGRAREADAPTLEPYVAFVGALASWQGIATMVQATRDGSWPAGLRLVVIGDGPERSEVEKDESVQWLGQLPGAEAHRWLAHAYCAISLKRSDTAVGQHGYWPFKLIESAAAGVPIVVSDAPGMAAGAELLGHAIVVPSQSPSAAAKAVADLWNDRGRRDQLARNGRNAVQDFDWTSGAESLGSFLNALGRSS